MIILTVSTEGRVISAHTYDVSVSGARISCKTGFPAGTVLNIVIYFKKTGQALCVDGEVKWSRRCKSGRRSEIGVEFLHAIPDTVVSLIGHFVRQRDPDPLLGLLTPG